MTYLLCISSIVSHYGLDSITVNTINDWEGTHSSSHILSSKVPLSFKTLHLTVLELFNLETLYFPPKISHECHVRSRESGWASRIIICNSWGAKCSVTIQKVFVPFKVLLSARFNSPYRCCQRGYSSRHSSEYVHDSSSPTITQRFNKCIARIVYLGYEVCWVWFKENLMIFFKALWYVTCASTAELFSCT